jgi:hypothetical protein
LAIGAVKRWARGGGKVHPSTRARAAAAVAHWEALKASTGRSETELIGRSVEVGELRNWAEWDRKATRAAPAPAAGSGQAQGAYAAGHPFFGNQYGTIGSTAVAAGGVSVGGKGSSTKAIPAPAKGGGAGKGAGKGGAGSAASKAAAAAAKQTALQNAVDSAQNAVDNANNGLAASQAHHDQSNAALTKAQANLSAAQDQAKKDIAFAQAKNAASPGKNTAQRLSAQGSLDAVAKAAQGRIQAAQNAVDSASNGVQNSGLSLQSAQTRLSQAQAALAKAKKAAGIRGDIILIKRDGFDGAMVTEGGSAANLLPVGPSRKQSKEITDSQEEVVKHRFQGSSLNVCTKPGCGLPINHKVHKITATAAAKSYPILAAPRMALGTGAPDVRHAGPLGHDHVPTGHVKGAVTKRVNQAKAQAQEHFSTVEGPLTDALQGLFERQRASVVGRLGRKTGKRMLRRAAELMERAGGPNEPPEIPPEDTGEQPPVPPSVSPVDIFNAGYWADQTAQVMGPHLQTAGQLAAGAVRHQVRMEPTADDSTSLGALRDIVDQRAAAAAQHISGTTGAEITTALQQGIAEGDGIAAIAKRVNDVFDRANIVRAKQIAQTEVVGAYNEGAHAYASALPPDVVGSRRWLSHHDDRTRPTHRTADGQEQQLGTPFVVGGYPMAFPGDKAAPPSEFISCRCSVAYLPPGVSFNVIDQAAKDYVAGLKAQPPSPTSPYKIPA